MVLQPQLHVQDTPEGCFHPHAVVSFSNKPQNPWKRAQTVASCSNSQATGNGSRILPTVWHLPQTKSGMCLQHAQTSKRPYPTHRKVPGLFTLIRPGLCKQSLDDRHLADVLYTFQWGQWPGLVLFFLTAQEKPQSFRLETRLFGMGRGRISWEVKAVGRNSFFN